MMFYLEKFLSWQEVKNLVAIIMLQIERLVQ